MSIVPRTNNRQNQQRSRPKKKKAPQKNRPRKQKLSRPQMNLSPCAMAYARALCNPFDYGDNELPCIPDQIDQPSFRYVVRQRGVFTTNATGFASILINPLAGSNDLAQLIYTDSTYVGTTIPGTAGTGAIGVVNTQFPFTSAGLRPHRTVSCALRVRYIGTTLNQSGAVILASEKNSIGSLGGQNYANLGTRLDADSQPCTRAWKSVLWCPAYNDMFNYTQSYSVIATNTGFLCAIVGNAGAAGMSWEYEVIWYKETQPYGVNSVPAMEKSHSDPVGFGVVRDFFSDVTFKEVGSSLYSQFVTFVKSGVATAAASYIGVPAAPLLLTM